MRLPRNDIRPPWSALASMGSTSRERRWRAIQIDEAESNTPEHRNRDGQHRIELRLCREALARGEPEQNAVELFDCRRHAGDDQPAERADDDREQDEARLARAHQGAQAPRHFEGRETDHGDPPADAGRSRGRIELVEIQHRSRKWSDPRGARNRIDASDAVPAGMRTEGGRVGPRVGNGMGSSYPRTPR
jgi:hypothetical protein